LKLLFDQNLSRRLAKKLSDIYPESEHVADAGLAEAADSAVWE
jgi:predicted nuclease of predicted toxin-antitoxin system